MRCTLPNPRLLGSFPPVSVREVSRIAARVLTDLEPELSLAGKGTRAPRARRGVGRASAGVPCDEELGF